MGDDFNYWEETQYYDICSKCNCRITSTRWCSKECWINQRYTEKENTNIPFDHHNFMNFNKDDFMYKTEYNILQIEPPIDEIILKKQYHKLSLKHHPDKGGDKNEFIKINEAYNKLLLIC